MTREKYIELEKEAIRLANILGDGKYWEIILSGSVQAYYFAKELTRYKDWS